MDNATSYISSPSICGDENNIYVVYRKSNENNIKVKYSTNGGANWSLLTPISPAISVNSLESIFSKNKLHIVYELNGKIYRRYYNILGNPPAWSSQANVSPTNDQWTYSNPRIAVWNAGSEDKVYYTYQRLEFNEIRWREFNVATGNSSDINWYFLQGQGFLPPNLGVAVDDQYIYSFNESGSFFSWNAREKSNNSIAAGTANSNENTYVDKIFSTTTYDNKTHTAAWSTLSAYPNRIVRMGFNHSHSLVYDVIHTETGLNPVNVVNISSAGNEAHVIWKDNFSNNKLRYKYDDQAPVAPRNLSVTSSVNNHPYLTWTPNPEPDIKIYEILKNGVPCTTTTNSYYEDVTETTVGNCPCHTVYYSIRAIDNLDHASLYSNTVGITVLGAPIEKQGVFSSNNLPTEFKINQNYPNPFNPSTKINYSVPEDAKINIIVYDILGREVAELVNEFKEPGFYEVNFNASGLNSGVYIYRITAVNDIKILYSEAKQMILIK